MAYNISVKDENKQLIPGATVYFVQGSTLLYSDVTNAAGYITVDPATDNGLFQSNVTVYAGKTGYSNSLSVPGDGLDNNVYFTIAEGPKSNLFLWLMVGGAALYFLSQHRK